MVAHRRHRTVTPRRYSVLPRRASALKMFCHEESVRCVRWGASCRSIGSTPAWPDAKRQHALLPALPVALDRPLDREKSLYFDRGQTPNWGQTPNLTELGV